jgi:hypothetical protein
MIRAWLIAPRPASDSIEEVQTCDSQAEQRLDSRDADCIEVAGLLSTARNTRGRCVQLKIPESWIFAAIGNAMMLNVI